MHGEPPKQLHSFQDMSDKTPAQAWIDANSKEGEFGEKDGWNLSLHQAFEAGVKHGENTLRTELDQKTNLLRKLWSHCKIIFFHGNEYPIEHNPFAMKDGKTLIESRLKKLP